MNIQGTEDVVLRHASYSLDECLGVLTEVSFVESYKERCMFHDIDRYLRERDFEFFGFHSLHEVGRAESPFTTMRSKLHQDGKLPGGQLVEAHALYLRDPLAAYVGPPINPKLIIFAELFGQVEYAFELLSTFDTALFAEASKLYESLPPRAPT